jgi:hypothetical protein
MERYRFHADGALFYGTFSVVDWLPWVNDAAESERIAGRETCGRAKRRGRRPAPSAERWSKS